MSELLDTWLAWREMNGRPISPHTPADYRGLVERKLKPGLGKLRVAQCDALVLDRFYARLRQGGNARTDGGPPSASRIRDLHAILSGALGLAACYGWIAFNPTRLTTPPAAVSETRAIPTPAQVRAVLEATAESDPRVPPVCAPCATTGNIVHAKGLERGYIRKKPESRHGERVLALDPHTLELLHAHQTRQQTRARNWGDRLADDRYIFSLDEADRAAARHMGGLLDQESETRSWRTYGPRRLRRQSEPALLATQGGEPCPYRS